MKKIIALLLSCILILSFAGCQDGSQGSVKELKGDLAKVDDEIITDKDVTEYMNLFAFSQGKYADEITDDKTIYYVMQTVLDNMIEQKILEHFLTSEGIDVMEGREDDFKSFKEKILDDEKMKGSYNEGVITDTGIEFLFRTHYFADSFYSVMKEKKNYSEKELRKYYDEHKDDMSRTIVDAAHIMVTDSDQAEEIYNKLTKENADFAALAAEYSQDVNTKDNGGELGEFGKNETIQAFEDAVFALEVGDISKPVLTDYGYHIIKLNDKFQKQLDFETCKDYILDLMISSDCNEFLGTQMNDTVEYLYE